MDKKNKALTGLAGAAVAAGALYKINSMKKYKDALKEALTEHLIVISLDGFHSRDLEMIQELPNVKMLMEEGSYCSNVKSIYPSVTYACHASIITGNYPDKHGVYNNEKFQPGVKESQWNWYDSDNKSTKLYDLAVEKGLKVGALFWPVMAGAKIQYNIPEIWPVKEGESQVPIILKYGTPKFALEAAALYGKVLKGKKQPYLNIFTSKTAKHMIKSKKPNLMLVHFTDVDHWRHKYGVFSNMAKEALKKTDKAIGDIIEATKKAGIYDNSTFIVIGDHAFIDVDHRICLNTAFRQAGLIDVNSNNEVIAWRAYANHCDGSCQIFLKDTEDHEAREKVIEIVEKLKMDGIEKLYTKEELMQKRVTGDFEFMVEAKRGYYFSNHWDAHSVVSKVKYEDFDPYDSEYYVGMHGFDPEKEDYRTVFIAAGKGVKKGVIIEDMTIVDEAPTFAKLLGLNLGEVDGRVLDIFQ